MRGGSAPSLALAALLAATLVPTAEGVVPAATTLGVTIAAPPGVGVRTEMLVEGRVNTLASAGVPQATVTLLRDGAPIATLLTDAQGRYAARVLAPPAAGDHLFSAHAQLPGALLAGESRAILVMVRERPLAPLDLQVTRDEIESTTYLSWSPTPDTRDAPLLSYRVTRLSDTTSQALATVSPTTLAFTDDSVHWGQTYRYYVQATTFAGDSPPSEIVELVMPPPEPGYVSANTTRVVACAPRCNTLAPGTYSFAGATLEVRPFVSGRVTTAGGDAIGGAHVALTLDLTVDCGACSPATGAREGSARTTASGHYDAELAPFSWSDYTPGECRDLRFDDTATTQGVTGGGSRTYRFCRSA